MSDFASFVYTVVRRIRPEMWFFIVLHVVWIQMMKHHGFNLLFVEACRLCGFGMLFVLALSQGLADNANRLD